MIQIKVGDLDVLETGTVQSNGNSPTVFLLDETMKIELLIEEKKNAPSSIELIPINNTLSIKYTNPHIQMHFGPQDPILIGTFQDRDLFCTFRVNTYGEYASYSIDYTFALGKYNGK